MACISGNNIIKFVWRQIICRFGLPHTIISDNGTQFASNPFREWCSGLCIRQNFTSVAHPQANGQTEVTNRTIVKGIKTRLDKAKGNWAEELQSVLWAYRTTPRRATKETPYSLVYGSEAVIPLEVCIPSHRTEHFHLECNEEALRHNLDLVEERREKAALSQAAYKSLSEAHYNKKVRRLVCKVGDLVLRKNEASLQEKPGKLTPNWEGPYRVKEARRNGSYVLETMEGSLIPRTWTMRNLRKFHF